MASIMCRDWYLLSTQPKLWEALAEAEFGITAEQLPDNSQHWKDVFADAYSAQNTFRSGPLRENSWILHTHESDQSLAPRPLRKKRSSKSIGFETGKTMLQNRAFDQNDEFSKSLNIDF